MPRKNLDWSNTYFELALSAFFIRGYFTPANNLQYSTMSYSLIALIAAIATLVLGSIFVFSSSRILKQWGLQMSDSVEIVSRRLGAVYLGFSVLLFLSRTSMPATNAIAIGVSVLAFGLAITGIVELRAGRVNKGIIRSVVTEILLGLAFLSTLLK